MFVQQPKPHPPEVHVPIRFADGRDPDALSRHRRADEDVPSFSLDPSIRADSTDLGELAVLEVAQAARHRTRRQPILVRRRAHLEAFVRSLPVVAVGEAIEGGLLRAHRRSKRHRRLGLKRLVEALMTPALLGMSRLDEDRLNLQLQRPDAESGAPGDSTRSKRRSVVAEHCDRQSDVAKKAIHKPLHALEPLTDQSAAQKQSAPVEIVDGQGSHRAPSRTRNQPL